MKNSLLISGSGGQGIVSAGILLAQSAAEAGKHATFLPEYGPEQRGGSAKCTVIISDGEIISPLPKKCLNFIAMNEQSYKKFGSQVKEGGLMLLNSNRVTSAVSRGDVRVISIPVDDIALEIGNPRAANIVMLGALIGATGIIPEEIFLKSLDEKFESKGEEVRQMNAAALRKGIELGINLN